MARPPARPLPRAGAHDSLLRPPLPQAQAERAALQAGDVVDLQIPIRPTKAPQLPFLPPKALGTVLADVTLPGVPLSALWRAAFANDAGFLVAFHTARRDYDIALTPWRTTGARRGGGLRRRWRHNSIGPACRWAGKQRAARHWCSA